MKNKITFRFIVLAVVVLFQISNIYAQKGTSTRCVENPPNEYCIEFISGQYEGYYQVIDPTDADSKKRFYHKNETLKFKKGVSYSLIIGLNTNSITLKVINDGTIENSNPVALNISKNKIEFNAVPIFIDPENYTGNYYFSTFKTTTFQTEGFCPFSKLTEFQTDKICPAGRGSTKPIFLVPNLNYFIEPHTIGYDSEIYFGIDKSGKIINMDNSRAASVVTKVKPQDTIKFKNRRIKIFTKDYEGVFYIGGIKEEIKRSEPKYYIVIPYAPTYIELKISNTAQTFIVTNYKVIPEKFILETAKGKKVNFEITR